MPIKLHPRSMQTIYEMLKCLSTEQQTALCNGFITAYSKNAKPKTITDWYCRDVVSLEDYANVEQAFLLSEDARKPIGPDSTGTNRIVYLLSQRHGDIPVVDSSDSEVYRFAYHCRELAPLRTANAGMPHSGAGGADFLGFRLDSNTRRPAAGEIKCDDDQNPFYAFVQLLAYVSALVTKNQIARANRHNLFGGSIGDTPSFDLVILLADFNDRGTKGPLIELTRNLASRFKASLERQEIGKGIGSILCLKMDSSAFAAGQPIKLHWKV